MSGTRVRVAGNVAKVAHLLRCTNVLTFGHEVLVVTAFGKGVVAEVVAWIANAASTISVRVRPEYPKFAAQRLFGRFLLEPGPKTHWRHGPDAGGLAPEATCCEQFAYLCRLII